MNRKTSACPKCGGAMQNGYLATRFDRFTAMETNWVDGEAVKSFWVAQWGVKAKDGSPVTTLRCQSCGFLESYALETET